MTKYLTLTIIVVFSSVEFVLLEMNFRIVEFLPLFRFDKTMGKWENGKIFAFVAYLALFGLNDSSDSWMLEILATHIEF